MPLLLGTMAMISGRQDDDHEHDNVFVHDDVPTANVLLWLTLLLMMLIMKMMVMSLICPTLSPTALMIVFGHGCELRVLMNCESWIRIHGSCACDQ